MEEKEKPYRTHDHEIRVREVKRELCMLLKGIALKRFPTQKHMALMLGISEQSAAYIVKGYVERVSFNQLFDLLVHIEPNFSMLIAMDHNTSRTISPRNCRH